MPRLVLPDHFTQRGNRRQQTFLEDRDDALYRSLIAEAARRAGPRSVDFDFGAISVAISVTVY